jgi:iron complex transport system permease protein
MSATSTPEPLRPGPNAGPTFVLPPETVRKRDQARWLWGLAFAFILSCLLAIAFGAEPVSLVRAALRETSLDHVIVVKARLPRVALAAIAGAGLSVAGAALQAMLRNPLAEPYLLGVSGGAALGATVAILAGVSSFTLLGAAFLPLAALAGGLLATVLVYSLARSTGSISGTEILLAGIIVNAVASALVTFAKTLATASRTQELLFWLVGFVEVPAPAALGAVTVYVAAGAVTLWLDAARLNLLALGEEPALHLGVDVRRLVRRVFFASSLLVGAIVSVTGLIGFVGLVVPHVARRCVGPDLRIVLPVCLLGGGTALVLSDLIARASFVWFGSEPPVGAVTALLGGPVALGLLRRSTMLRS